MSSEAAEAAPAPEGEGAEMPAPAEMPTPEEMPAPAEIPTPELRQQDNSLMSGLDSLMPALLFLLFNRFFGLGWAIGAATVWSLRVIWSRRRKQIPIGRVLPLVAGFVVARGIIGIITDSEAVYFGLGIASKFAIGLGVAIAAKIGRNVLAIAVPYVFDFSEEVRSHPIYVAALDRIAYVAGLYYVVSAGFDIWLYNNNSVEGYIIIRMMVNWPLGIAVFWGCVAYLTRRLRQVPEFPGLYKLLEQRAEQVELKWERRRQERELRRQSKHNPDTQDLLKSYITRQKSEPKRKEPTKEPQ